jgi:phosphoribosylaminoimidazole-succinocarboxamide synthase
VQGDTEVSSDLVVMEKYPVIFPKREVVAGLPVYDYSEYREATVKLVALEHIVRRGNPGGSSLQSRYEKLARISQSEADAFLATFGTQGPLEPWSLLPNLAVEWSTKFEGYDRYLSTQEALLIAGVNAATLNRVVDLLMLATVQVNDFVSSTSLELWDLKWELAVQTDGSSEDRDIVIVDTIDHDSMRLALRLTHELIGPSIVHFNKQAVRDYYKIFHRDWWASLDEIKELSNLPGADSFKDILWNGIKEGRYPQPPGLEDDFADLQGRKYELVTAGPAADPSMGQALALEEISYYSKRGRLEEFRRFNALS